MGGLVERHVPISMATLQFLHERALDAGEVRHIVKPNGEISILRPVERRVQCTNLSQQILADQERRRERGVPPNKRCHQRLAVPAPAHMLQDDILLIDHVEVRMHHADVRPSACQFELRLELLRQPDIVAIQERNPRSTRRLDAAVPRPGRSSVVLLKPRDPVRLFQSIQHRLGAIVRAIVDNENLHVFDSLRAHALHCLSDKRCAVEHRDHDAHQGFSGAHCSPLFEPASCRPLA